MKIKEEQVIQQICDATGLSWEQVVMHIRNGEVMLNVYKQAGKEDVIEGAFVANNETLSEEENQYRRKQLALYTSKIGDRYSPDKYNLGYDIAGRWEEHEQYPYDKYLLEKHTAEELQQLKISGSCFDFGCGNGRMLYHMEKYFNKIHGGDLMPEFVEAAKRYLSFMQIDEDRFQIYATQGANSKIAQNSPEGSYDFVFSTVVLIHILPHFVKMNILKDHYDLLKTGGRMCHQMIYCKTAEDYEPNGGKLYRWGDLELEPSTGQLNTIILEEDLDRVRKDLEGIGFKNIDFILKETPHENSTVYKKGKWIYIHAQK